MNALQELHTDLATYMKDVGRRARRASAAMAKAP
jgi:hypothetical protein